MANIEVYGKYGDPRTQAARANMLATAHAAAQQRGAAAANPLADSAVPWHPGRPMQAGWYGADWMGGRSPMEQRRMQDRFESFVPRMATAGGPGRAQDFFSDLLPAGAQLAPNAGAGYRQAMQNHYDMRRTGGSISLPGGGQLAGGNVFQQTQRPYQPEFESPDRQNYPIHRNLANIYWRLFYKLDAIIGNGVDMYSELPFGDVEFTGEGVDGEVKDTFERAWEVCNIRALLPYFVREYLVTGEACPQCFYDKSQGIWTYVGMHNPDQLEVIHTPFIKMDPIVRFKPDNRLQQVLASGSDMVRHVRESMPPELLSALMSGQPIELHPLNFTFLPRKMHPYDVRGTSILSRMWRALMYEDAIFNASIATARRHAGPIKVAKLGDRATGWIPDPSHEQRLLELLAQAELDPHAWIVYHYGIEFDLVGTTDRVMTIDKHWDLIERIKLIALGISKAFLHGEVTYASAASGLTVFLQRLKALREYFEAAWIVPKFFKPLAVMNAWVKPTDAELAHGVRTRRSKQDLLEDNRWIIPTLEWARQLDPSVEQAQIQAVQALTQMGVVFSKQYLASLSGRDWEEELTQRAREAEIEQKLIQKNPALQMALMQPAGGEGGGGGGGMMPGLAPESMGFPGGEPGAPGAPGEGGGAPPGPPEAGVHAGPGESGGPGGRQWKKPAIWQNGRCGNWEEGTVADLLGLFEGEAPEEEAWDRMVTERPGIAEFARHGDGEGFWDAVEEWLEIEGYPAEDIMTLEDILKLERVLGGTPKGKKAFNLDKELDSLDKEDDARLLVGAP
jgi:hypothetical protein